MKKLFIIYFLISVPLCSMNKPETVAEFIKNQNYYDQKKLFKEKKGDHPLMIVVNDLQKSNKTVQSFVKDFLKVKRKESEEQLKKDFKISEEQWKEIQERWQFVKRFEKEKKRNDIIFEYQVTDDIKKLIEELHSNFVMKNTVVVQNLQIISSTKSPAASGTLFKKDDQVNLLLINNKKLVQYLPIEKTGILAHEMAHLKKHHGLKSEILVAILDISEPNFIKTNYSHNQEYEADQYAAAKKISYALGLEKFLTNYTGYFFNLFFAQTRHPTAIKRYRAVKTIRKLLEHEQQWYNGPKGYNKYGEPAYERMWDMYCASANKTEKQQKLPEYLVMPL